MERAMAETKRRREKQEEYNAAHGITPQSVKSQIKDILASHYEKDHVTVPAGVAEEGGGKAFLGDNFKTTLKDLEGRMRAAASNLEFEEAARLRDEIKRLKLLDLEFANDALSGPGEGGDRGAVKQIRAEARAEKAEEFRKMRGRRRKGP
jgi:excinuclease ABC subunit B